MSQDVLGQLKHLKTARARWPFPDVCSPSIPAPLCKCSPSQVRWVQPSQPTISTSRHHWCPHEPKTKHITDETHLPIYCPPLNLTSQCCTAVSIDTCTAVARFLGQFWRWTRAQVAYPRFFCKTHTRTCRNPYPWARVRVFWGTGVGSSGKSQGYPCQSLRRSHDRQSQSWKIWRDIDKSWERWQWYFFYA